MQLAALALLICGIVSANAFTADQIRFQQEALAHHNQLRARHCTPLLQLDDALSNVAQRYAEQLIATNSFEHSNNGYGENLYMMSGGSSLGSLPGSTGTQDWYDEIDYYNFNSPGFSMDTGHFTQVIWKGSNKLGMGIAFGNGGRKVVIVGNYYPPGNYWGQFSENVLRPNC